jgi:hypothetical protein
MFESVSIDGFRLNQHIARVNYTILRREEGVNDDDSTTAQMWGRGERRRGQGEGKTMNGEVT